MELSISMLESVDVTVYFKSFKSRRLYLFQASSFFFFFFFTCSLFWTWTDLLMIMVSYFCRLRVNCVGVFDVLTFDNSQTNHLALMPQYQVLPIMKSVYCT